MSLKQSLQDTLEELDLIPILMSTMVGFAVMVILSQVLGPAP
jgi:hypothetical protein